MKHPLNRGPSPHGWHTWSPYLECSKRAIMLAAQPLEGISKSALIAGLIYHAFQEIYRKTKKRELDTATIQFDHFGAVSSVSMQSARLVAERAFRIYRTKFPPDYFGKVIGTEVSISGELPHIGRATARLDLLTTVFPASKWKKDAGRQIFSPMRLSQDVCGEWAIDYKLEAGTQDPMRYAYDPQFWWQYALRPQLKGIIVDIATKESTSKFPLVILPAEWLAAQRPVLNELLQRMATAKAAPRFDSRYCFNRYGEACRFLRTCPRHNTEEDHGKED